MLGMPTPPRMKQGPPSRVPSDFTDGFWLPRGSEDNFRVGDCASNEVSRLSGFPGHRATLAE